MNHLTLLLESLSRHALTDVIWKRRSEAAHEVPRRGPQLHSSPRAFLPYLLQELLGTSYDAHMYATVFVPQLHVRASPKLHSFFFFFSEFKIFYSFELSKTMTDHCKAG